MPTNNNITGPLDSAEFIATSQSYITGSTTLLQGWAVGIANAGADKGKLVKLSTGTAAAEQIFVGFVSQPSAEPGSTCAVALGTFSLPPAADETLGSLDTIIGKDVWATDHSTFTTTTQTKCAKIGRALNVTNSGWLVVRAFIGA